MRHRSLVSSSLATLALLGCAPAAPPVASRPAPQASAEPPVARAAEPLPEPARDAPSAAQIEATEREAVEPTPAEAEATGDGDPMIGLDGLVMDDARDPLEPRRLHGPFPTLEAYVAQRESDADEDCAPPTHAVSVAPKTLPGSGPVSAVRLFRLPTGDACEPTETCLIGLETGEGWFVGERWCAGPVQGDRYMTTKDTALRWVSVGGGDAVAVEYTVTVHASVAKGAASVRGKATGESVRWLRLCGLGRSGHVSCTRPAIVSCVEAGGGRDSASVSAEAGQLVLKSSSVPGEACDGNPAFLTGSFAVAFD